MTSRDKARRAFVVPKKPQRSAEAPDIDRVVAAVTADPPAPEAPETPAPTPPAASSPVSPAPPTAPAPSPPAEAPPDDGAEGSAGYRRRKGKGERVTLYLSPKVKRAAEMRCLREQRSLSEATEAALALWLRTPKAP